MPLWEIEAPDGTLFEVEGEEEPTESQIKSFFTPEEPIQQPTIPRLQPGATLADVLRQPPLVTPPWEGGVVRSVLPGVLQPEDLLPAVRKIGGSIAEGEPGDTHPDIITREQIPAIEIDQRGFTGPEGQFLDREAAAQATGIPTMREPGRLHSTDLSAFQPPEEQGSGPIDVKAIAPWMFPKEQEPTPSLTPVTADAVSAITPEGKKLLPGTPLPPMPAQAETGPTYPSGFPGGIAGEMTDAELEQNVQTALDQYSQQTTKVLEKNPVLSALHFTPEDIPSGEEFSQALNIPKAIGIPVSTAEKLLSGALGFFGSLSGASQAALAEIAAVKPLLFAKWSTDIAASGGEQAANFWEALKRGDMQAASDAGGSVIADILMLTGGKVPGGKRVPGLVETTAKSVVPGIASVLPKEAPPVRTLTPAIRLPDGRIFRGPAHKDIFLTVARETGEPDLLAEASKPQNQGFVNEKGEFLSRADASPIFKELTGKEPADVGSLKSEDFAGFEHLFDFGDKATPKVAEKPPTAEPANPSIGAGIRAALMRKAEAGAVPIPGSVAQQPGYGIAHRVSEARGVAAPRGEGIAPADSVQHGRELLSKGLDPNSVVDIFNKTRAVRADDIAVARAHGENLARAANEAADKFGLDSPEYKAAAKADKDWIAKVKPMQTEWHKIGQAQQGETAIDTGSYHGLSRARFEDSGKDFTPKESKTAKALSSKVKTAAKATEAAKQKLYSETSRTVSISSAESRAMAAASKTVREAAARMAKAQAKSRAAFTAKERDVAKIQEEYARKALDAANKRARDAAVKQAQYEQRRSADPARAIWEQAKKYIEKGEDNFDEIRHKLATDLGMPVDQVTRLMAQSKRAKFLMDEVWRKQQVQRQLHAQAKIWLRSLDTPLLHKAIASIPRALFSLKVGFHGTVALGTHAPMVAFQPRFWKTYIKDFAKMYKMVGSPAYYERQIQDLVRRDNYITARRAGLVNDPHVFEEYHINPVTGIAERISPKVADWFNKATGMGNRGYAVLKIIRQDMFDQMWNKLPRTSQIPEVAEALADGINHATGVVKGRAPAGTNVALFAPRLEASRVMWLAGDPIRAADTFIHWNKASQAEKIFALNQVKEKAWVAGTMMGMLALNQGLLTAIGSDQKINGIPESMGGAGFDPMRSDFLKFKVAGMNIGYGNAMLTMARLPLRLYVGVKNEGKFNKMVYEDENVARTLFGYARSQASPFAGLVLNLGLGRDYQERPLPKAGFGLLPGKTNIPKRLQAQGIRTPYTWKELWAEQLAPIPFQEAMVEVWKTGMGMNEEQIVQMKKAMATIAVMAATGARFTEDIPYSRPQPRTLQEALQQR